MEFTEELESARTRLSQDLQSVLDLRPLPATALRINKACQDEQIEISILIDLIQCDPAIATRILSLVNSPLYGFPREIDSLNRAVVALGFKKLAELVTSIAAKQVFEKDSQSKLACVAIFEHSIACATAARVLFQRHHGKHDAGAAFLSGILHDVGKLFLYDIAPNSYSQLRSTAETIGFVEREINLFGKSHAELGMQFASTSGLPVTIRRAIEQHHASDSTDRSILAANVDLANSLVKIWGIGGGADLSPHPLADQWLADQEDTTIDVVRESIRQRFQVLRSLFLG